MTYEKISHLYSNLDDPYMDQYNFETGEIYENQESLETHRPRKIGIILSSPIDRVVIIGLILIFAFGFVCGAGLTSWVYIIQNISNWIKSVHA